MAIGWLGLFVCFVGGAVLANAIPHLVSGVMGRPFQTPFARLRGERRSSSVVNVVWAFVNLIVAWLLLRAGGFELGVLAPVLAAGLGAFAMSIGLASWFGRFNGGDLE